MISRKTRKSIRKAIGDINKGLFDDLYGDLSTHVFVLRSGYEFKVFMDVWEADYIDSIRFGKKVIVTFKDADDFNELMNRESWDDVINKNWGNEPVSEEFIKRWEARNADPQ